MSVSCKCEKELTSQKRDYKTVNASGRVYALELMVSTKFGPVWDFWVAWVSKTKKTVTLNLVKTSRRITTTWQLLFKGSDSWNPGLQTL